MKKGYENFNKKGSNKIFILSIILILIFILLLILIFCFNLKKSGINEAIFEDGKKINLELAITPYEQEQGLMFRKELKKDSGMLFVFNDESIKTFWMKNTLIPLDIIFIDSNNRIINIENAIPCNADPCKIYKSKSPVKYVLEINSDSSKFYNLSVNEEIVFNKL